jgi:hypothetical protein
MTSSLSAFRWREFPRPSIFASDVRFTAGAKSGKAMTQIASQSVVKITARTGKNPGSIKGLSGKGDKLIEQAEHDRRRR